MMPRMISLVLFVYYHNIPVPSGAFPPAGGSVIVFAEA